MRTPRPLLVAGIIASLTLTGCGSTQDDPVDTAYEALNAIATLDGKTLCDLSLQASGPDASDEDKEDCLEGVAERRTELSELPEEDRKTQQEAMDAITDLDRDSMTAETDGDESSVAFKISVPGSGSEEGTVRLEKHDGKWYVADI